MFDGNKLNNIEKMCRIGVKYGKYFHDFSTIYFQENPTRQTGECCNVKYKMISMC
jgi:hypothetical protein